MRTIALFLPNWIGDVVMATPAIAAVRTHFPEARLLAVCKSYVADVVAGSPWFDEVIPFDKGGAKEKKFFAVAKRLRDSQTDTALLFPNSFRAALLARIAGCRTVVGFARYFRDALLTRRLYPTRDSHGNPKPVPAIDDYARLVRLLGVEDPDRRMRLFTTAQDEKAADSVWSRFGLSRFRQVVAFNPGGAFGSSKHWPTEHFVELARMIVDRRDVGVVVLCGPAEREIAKCITDGGARPAVIGLHDVATSIGLTKAIVRRVDAMVTTDSGPRHFAAAFDVPVVTLFGATHIGWTETYFDKAIHLQKKVPCGPCQQRVCPLGHHRCMKDLTPIEVFGAVERLFREFMDDKERRHAG